MRAHLVLAVLTSLALAGCGSGPDGGSPDIAATTSTSAMDGAVADPNAPVTAEDAAMPRNAQAFVDAVATSDGYELEAAKLAQSMSMNPGIRNYAGMMITAHTASSAELKAVSSRLAQPLIPAPKPDAEMAADIAALKSAGPRFDQVFAQKQVAAHEKVLGLLQGYAAGGDDPALKDFAAKSAEVVTQHLDAARALKP